jgi:transcriptional regulator with XRE-family HTH domain
MPPISQIVEISASGKFRNLGSALIVPIHQIVDMDERKNGGPNYLEAWRKRQKLTLEALSEQVGTSASVIGYLESGERGLSAKWLRRLAPALGITPGLLLDHHPDAISDDMIEMWKSADEAQKRQLVDMAKVILNRTGTEG